MDQDGRLQQLAQAVVDMDRDAMGTLVQSALDEGFAPSDILSRGLSHGMRIVGNRFRDGICFMPEVLVSCDTYYAGLQLVQPLIEMSGVNRPVGKIVIGTIHGDIHTVGKDVAVPVFRAAGFQVVDLGIDVADQEFVQAIREHTPDIVGLGTYMTSTFMHTSQTVKAIEEAGLHERVKITGRDQTDGPRLYRQHYTPTPRRWSCPVVRSIAMHRWKTCGP